MRKILTSLFVVWVLLLTPACRTTDSRDEPSIGLSVAAGSELALHKDLSLPQGRRRIYLQFGRPMKKRDEDFTVGCYFRALNEDTTVIRADTFTISRVTDYREDVLEGDILDFITEFRLKSAMQPEVLKLVCHKWDSQGLGKPPTLPQIRKALGDYASFILKP